MLLTTFHLKTLPTSYLCLLRVKARQKVINTLIKSGHAGSCWCQESTTTRQGRATHSPRFSIIPLNCKTYGRSKRLHRCKQHFMQNHVRYYLLLKLPLLTVFSSLIYSFNLLDKDPSIPLRFILWEIHIRHAIHVFSSEFRDYLSKFNFIAL